MGLEVGIVGLPNVGKSTLYQAITSAEAEAANYPFCTIEPNVGMVEVPDERLDKIAAIFNPPSVIHNLLKMVDIAGLVKGASKGEGLGNKFLTHIRQVDAIAHIVRCFEDENITHVQEGKLDPLGDIELIKTELILADMEQADKRRDKIQRQGKGNTNFKGQIAFLERLCAQLEAMHFASELELESDDEKAWLAEMTLITAKPYFYVLNVSEEMINQDNELTQAVKDLAKTEKVHAITICSKLEADLAQMEPEEKAEFMTELNLDRSGLDQVIAESFRLLGQISFFTAGEKEVRAWNTQGGSLAPEAAGKIHTDMQRGFIRAEVYHFDDLIVHKSEPAVKQAGKLRLEGKEYPVRDGDIMHFRFNV